MPPLYSQLSADELEAMHKLLDDAGVSRDRWEDMSGQEKEQVYEIIRETALAGYSTTLSKITEDIWDHPPPDIRTILSDPYYLGDVGGGDLYPLLVDDMIEIFTDTSVLEVILTGSIGWGKTFFAALGMAIEVILLLHLKDPQEYCGVATKSKISLVNMSVTASNAEGILYNKVFQFLSNCPWIQEHYPVDDRTGLLFKEKNIEFRPGSSSEMAVIGDDLIGAALDEANFMVGAKRSKRAILAGEYDVAKIIYDAIARRRISRFVGVLGGTVAPPAHMWLISSKQFPGDFLELKIAAVELLARKGEKIHTKIMDYSQWETRLSLPPAKCPYSGVWFAIFIGDAMHESRILGDDEEYPSREDAERAYPGTIPEGCKVVAVPVEYKSAFIEDLYGSIRDFAGHAILASKPFFSNTPAFTDMICNKEIGDIARVHPYEYVQHDVVAAELFVIDRIPVSYDEHGKAIPFLNPDAPRYAHFDQSTTGDYTGFAICHFGGWKDVKLKMFETYKDSTGNTLERFVDMTERRPIIICDFMMRVSPPVGGRIDHASLRILLYAFQRLSGIRRFAKITYDQFEAEAQIAALKAEGYPAERFSVDFKSAAAYGYLRDAINNRRFSMYSYEPFVDDLTSIERTVKGKVDHRAGGTKDVSDCVAGCVHHIETDYARHRVPLIPDAGSDFAEDKSKSLFDRATTPGHLGEEELEDLGFFDLLDQGQGW